MRDYVGAENGRILTGDRVANRMSAQSTGSLGSFKVGTIGSQPWRSERLLSCSREEIEDRVLGGILGKGWRGRIMKNERRVSEPATNREATLR